MRTLGMPTTSEFMGTHPLKDCKPIQAETFKRAAPLLIVVFLLLFNFNFFSFGFSLFCVVLRVSSNFFLLIVPQGEPPTRAVGMGPAMTAAVAQGCARATTATRGPTAPSPARAAC